MLHIKPQMAGKILVILMQECSGKLRPDIPPNAKINCQMLGGVTANKGLFFEKLQKRLQIQKRVVPLQSETKNIY